MFPCVNEACQRASRYVLYISMILMEPSTSGAERRTAVRYSLHLVGSARALYRRGIPQRPGDREPQNPAGIKIETVNVSTGGLMITFDAELSSGDVLQVFLPHPEAAKELTAEGQIQWMHKNTTGLLGRYCGGISFRNTPERTVRALVDYAARLAKPDGIKRY